MISTHLMAVYLVSICDHARVVCTSIWAISLECLLMSFYCHSIQQIALTALFFAKCCNHQRKIVIVWAIFWTSICNHGMSRILCGVQNINLKVNNEREKTHTTTINKMEKTSSSSPLGRTMWLQIVSGLQYWAPWFYINRSHFFPLLFLFSIAKVGISFLKIIHFLLNFPRNSECFDFVIKRIC